VGYGTTLKTPRTFLKKTHLPKNSTSHISLSTEGYKVDYDLPLALTTMIVRTLI